MNAHIYGLGLLLLAGGMNGSFTLPMKFTRRWAWENTWLVYTIFALGLFPPLLTLATVPAIGAVYAQAGAGPVVMVALFGAGWGISQIFFGLAVDAVGIALAFSIILGVAAVVGSLIPLLRLHPEKVFTPAGIGVLFGIALMLLGIGVCAAAGRRREKALGEGPVGKRSIGKGLLFCLISGLGSALVNFGLAFGTPLIDAAAGTGTSALWAPNAVWLPLMLAGGIPNVVYCIYLMQKNKTADRFGIPGTSSHWALAALMALFWFGSTVMYGAAAVMLGNLGTVLGWPLFMSLIVVTASIWGVVTGEWRNTGKQPLRIMIGGVGVLVLAICVLSAASRWV
jgi:L-rhamnose-H+ transport protein